MDNGGGDSTIYGAISAGAAAILAALFGFLKFKKSWVGDSAEISVVQLLREQVEIFSAQNTELHKMVSELRDNVESLREENFELRSHVNELSSKLELTKGLKSGRRLSDKVGS